METNQHAEVHALIRCNRNCMDIRLCRGPVGLLPVVAGSRPDLTDESYYLTAAINPDAVILWATAMHWFTSGLWQLSGSLAGFRGMGLAILAVSSMVLALGAVRAFQICGHRRCGPRFSDFIDRSL